MWSSQQKSSLDDTLIATEMEFMLREISNLAIYCNAIVIAIKNESIE